MQEKLISNEVHFPEFWDLDKVCHAFTTLSTLELYKYFDCASPTAFGRMMNKCMPQRPSKLSFSEYMQEVLK